MKKMWLKLLSVLILIVFIFSVNTIVNSQVKRIERINPKVIQGMQLATGGPTIVMQRTTLESPKGMKLFKIQTLQVQPDLIKRLSQVHMFKVAPKMMKDNMTAAKINVYSSEKEEFTKLIVNEDRGHIELMPDIQKLEKLKVNLLKENLAMDKATLYAAEMKLIPQDQSQFVARKMITLNASTVKQGGAAVDTPKLQSILFQRNLEGKTVIGNGSQLVVQVGDNGNIEGFQRKINQLIPESRARLEFRTDQEVYDRIEQILKQQIQGNVEIQVETPRLVYYGNDRQYVQPAYFFSTTLTTQKGEKAYYWGAVEALKNSPEPTFEKTRPAELPAGPANNMPISIPDPDDPTVGRYVVRNDSWDWVGDANDFKSGLNNGHCGGCPAITYPQYYWNEPRLFTTQDNSFADSVHIALMEGHGNHWLFTTRSNCCDVVYLNDGAQPGYGGHAGGQMAYLILKGCDIIPSPIEVGGSWPDPWWRIFKGLHQAIGFRTTMYINDDISYIFGYYLGRNCRVLDSWFYATNSSSSYQWQRFWGGHVTGYGSVVMIPGHEGDGIYYTTPAADATSAGLTIWYQH
jgi:hypothetical protein